jgi:hypothetical protein
MAQRGRPPKVPGAPEPGSGVVISKASKEEIEGGRAWKKEKPIVSFDVIRIMRDGKQIVKVRKVESRSGVTDQSLVFQSVNGKPVRQLMTVQELTDLGVNLKY